MELIENDLRIEFEDCGEGWDGDYNPDDPEDTALLRFYVSERTTDAEGGFSEIEDASYCTQIAVDAPEDKQRELLRTIMDEVRPVYESGESIKRICETMSWLSS